VLTFAVGDALTVRIGVEPRLADRIAEYLRHLRVDAPPPGTALAAIGMGPCPVEPGRFAAPVASGPGTAVRRAGEVLRFETGGGAAWCDPSRGVAGFEAAGAGDETLDRLAAPVLTALLFELARPHGLTGVHAAALAPGGRGILLPGDHDVGKSTIVRSAAARGVPVLSDDLVWVQESDAGFRLWAFRRGAPADPAPPPTADGVPLAAIVLPSIVHLPRSELRAAGIPEVVGALAAQAGYLPGGADEPERFRTLVRVASAVPAWSLAAGADRDAVPALVSGLIA